MGNFVAVAVKEKSFVADKPISRPYPEPSTLEAQHKPSGMDEISAPNRHLSTTMNYVSHHIDRLFGQLFNLPIGFNI